MKILNKFTWRNLLKNKKRTIVTIVGTFLAVSLLFVVGLVFSSVRDTEIQYIVQSNGDHHVQINNVDSDYKVKKIIQDNPKIDHFVTLEVVDSLVDDYEEEFKIKSASFDYDDNFVLTSGKLPTNNNEIIIDYDLSKERDIAIGATFGKDEIIYKVVGIYKESKFDHYVHENGYIDYTNVFYTKSEGRYPEEYYIYFKNMEDTVEETYKIAQQANFPRIMSALNDNQYENVYINSQYLMWFGVGNKEYMHMIKNWIVAILSVLAIFSSLAIYNAFAISVSERKKLFGIFRSMGATKKHIFLSVLYEAFLIAIIAIPLGILFSFFLALVVSSIIKSNFPDTNFRVVIYPAFAYISLIFSIIMIFLSAIIPAFRSSRVMPLEAIRLNNETKVKKKKIKKKKGLLNLFGGEAILARNNITRNSKKYTSAKISLIISIILFMFMGTLVDLLLGEVEKYEPEEYPIIVNVDSSEQGKKLVNEIISYKEIDKYRVERSIIGRLPVANDYFTDEYLKYNSYSSTDCDYVVITSFDRKNYDALKKRYGVQNDVAFVNKNLYNFSESQYEEDVVIPKWKGDVKSISIYNTKQIENPNATSSKDRYICDYDVNNPYYTFNNIYFIDDSSLTSSIIILEEEYEHINDKISSDDASSYYNGYTIKIDSDKYKDLDRRIKQLEDNYIDITGYTNMLVEYEEYYKTIYGVKAGIYAFFAFIILIAATNVINTINTSIDLRKRDFAVLRSVGLSKKAFNKMLFYEGVVLGFDALVWGHLISGGFIFLISMSNIFSENIIVYPFTYLLISIIGIYVIIFGATYFAARKVKKANIIETIRNDNV